MGAVEIRAHLPGELGWVVGRHGRCYARDHGFDESFEALVAEVLARYVRAGDRNRERLWIAARGETPLGSIMLTRRERATAQLRLFWVEPEARGLGVGTALLETCVRFAEACGYARIVLWTQDFSTVARRLYARHGFQRRESYPDVSCGRSLVIERWERKVRA